MSIDLEEKEFVALDTKAIRKLLASGIESSRDRRNRDRRRQQRWPFDCTVQLWLHDAMGEEFEIHATCRNMNDDGVGLECDRPLQVGLQVPIAIHQPEATYHGKGVVRHCTISNGAYFVGVELIGNEV